MSLNSFCTISQKLAKTWQKIWTAADAIREFD
jgi:hypothetical protein